MYRPINNRLTTDYWKNERVNLIIIIIIIIIIITRRDP